MKAITSTAVVSAALLAWGCSDQGPTRSITPSHPSLSTAFEQTCTACHDLQRLNQVSFASLSEASALVQRMVGYGADLQGCSEEAFCRYIFSLRGDDETIADW